MDVGRVRLGASPGRQLSKDLRTPPHTTKSSLPIKNIIGPSQAVGHGELVGYLRGCPPGEVNCPSPLKSEKKGSLEYRSSWEDLMVVLLWGMVDGEDNLAKYHSLCNSATGTLCELLTARTAPALSHGMPFIPLVSFDYNIHATNHTQVFPIFDSVAATGMDFGVVVLEILDNWGKLIISFPQVLDSESWSLDKSVSHCASTMHNHIFAGPTPSSAGLASPRTALKPDGNKDEYWNYYDRTLSQQQQEEYDMGAKELATPLQAGSAYTNTSFCVGGEERLD
ncbi:hypothetical protein EDC04DRAFT_2610980 [Pisolithus marmoratus]|nr:hypothetical protein EDC04DRAFT_2610980 [Pisolithus marmoratus]